MTSFTTSRPPLNAAASMNGGHSVRTNSDCHKILAYSHKQKKTLQVSFHSHSCRNDSALNAILVDGRIIITFTTYLCHLVQREKFTNSRKCFFFRVSTLCL